MSFIALILTILVGLFILVGTIVGISLKNNKKIIDFSISIAFGVLIALIAVELIPEILEIIINTIGKERGIIIVAILVFLGFTVLQQLDLFIPHHEDENHSHKHICYNEHLKHIGIVTSISLIVYNVIEGMSLYITTINDLKMGLILCIGIGLHNLPLGLIISSTFMNEYDEKKTIIISSLISLSTMLGGVFILFSGIESELIIALLLSVSLGMLIYITFFELLEQVLYIEDKKTSSIGIVLGIVILIISVIFS